LYYTVATYTWEDSLLSTRYEVLHYGDGSDTMMIWDERFIYAPNMLKNGTTATTSSLQGAQQIKRFTVHGESLELCGIDADKIGIYSLSGRMIREVSGQQILSLSGISRNQPLFAVAFREGTQILVTKILK